MYQVTVKRSVDCPSCGSAAVEIGEVPYSFHFLAHKLCEPLDTGDLYECSSCGLWFKAPYLPEETLLRYYELESGLLSWGEVSGRVDFAAVLELITGEFPGGGRVLDFGCYTGQFLRTLPEHFSKFGIEPSESAATEAARNGIQILSRDLNEVGPTGLRFSAITLFDVFEHLSRPLSILDQLFSLLSPNGLLCIVTGSANHRLFRWAGPKYNYVCMPEHVCFSRRSLLASWQFFTTLNCHIKLLIIDVHPVYPVLGK